MESPAPIALSLACSMAWSVALAQTPPRATPTSSTHRPEVSSGSDQAAPAPGADAGTKAGPASHDGSGTRDIRDPRARGATLRLVMTGGGQGFSSWSTSFEGPFQLLRYFRSHPGRVIPERVATSTYFNGSRLLFRIDPWTVEEFRAFLGAGPHRFEHMCADLPILADDQEVDFEPDPACLSGPGRSALELLAMVRGAGPLVRGAPQRNREVRGALAWYRATLTKVIAADGQSALMLTLPWAPAGQGFPTDPLVWENRLVSVSRVEVGDSVHHLHAVGRPRNEGSRRARYLAEVLGDGRPLWIDAGNAVEGTSFLDRRINLDWPLSWETIGRLGLTILVPGVNDLHPGVSELSKAATEAKVTLVSSNLVGGDGSPMFKRYALLEVQGQRVGIVGVSDPVSIGTLNPTLLEGGRVQDPITSVHEALKLMREQSGDPLDVVMLVGNLQGRIAAELLEDLTGVDLVFLTDPHLHDSPWPLVVDAPGVRGARRPLLVRRISLWGPELVEVGLTEAGLTRVEIRPAHIDDSWPVDQDVLRGVLQIRQDLYDEGREILIPDVDPIIKGDPELVEELLASEEYRHLTQDEAKTQLASIPARLTEELWTQLVASNMRRAVDADVAFVQRVPMAWKGAGPITKLFCQANLASTSSLVAVNLPGSALKAIRGGKLGLSEIWASGMTRDGAKIGGRAIGDNEWYLVVMTDVLWLRPEMKEILEDAKVSRGEASLRFVRRGAGFVPDESGARLSLRTAVLTVLEARRAAHPDMGDEAKALVAEDLKPGGDRKRPVWYVDFKDLSLGLESYLEPDLSKPELYDQIQETRVHTKSNLRQTYRADVSLVLDTPWVAWLNRGLLSYDVQKFDETDGEVESADDLLGETELRLAFLGTTLPSGIGISPAAKLSFDSEVTPVKDSDGHDLPRQALMRASFGVAASGTGDLKVARLGLLVQQDLRENDEGRYKTDVGLGFELDHRMGIGPLKWSNQLDARWYLPQETDTRADLGMRVAGRSSLRMPFMRDLSFEVYVDVFLFQGKFDDMKDMGMSTILGLAMSYSRLWKPGRERLF